MYGNAVPTLVPRSLLPLAADMLDTFPALVIEGARQVGKSTFAQQLVNGRNATTVTLDDVGALEAARFDPAAFIDQGSTHTLVVDEVQRAPELILAIKASIDRERRPGRFVLTGSSDFLRSAPDSLAGRAVTVRLRPFSQGEVRGLRDDLVGRLTQQPAVGGATTTVSRRDYVEVLARGGYPEARELGSRMRNAWFDSYVERLLNRDAADLAPRTSPGRLSSVLRLLAASQSGELVKARLARDAHLPETSVAPYVDLLEALFLVDSTRPWTPNLTSRESSRHKVAVTDSALALRLARVSEQQLAPVGSSFIGAALEGFVVLELQKQRDWSSEEFELFHYRDRDGLEVDVVAELADGSIIGFEVKASSTFKGEHFVGLRALRDRLGSRFVGGYVLGMAQQSAAFGDRLWGLPVSSLWELTHSDS